MYAHRSFFRPEGLLCSSDALTHGRRRARRAGDGVGHTAAATLVRCTGAICANCMSRLLCPLSAGVVIARRRSRLPSSVGVLHYSCMHIRSGHQSDRAWSMGGCCWVGVRVLLHTIAAWAGKPHCTASLATLATPLPTIGGHILATRGHGESKPIGLHTRSGS